MNEMLLDELFERLGDLKERKANYFGGDENCHEGDKGYQDLWQELDEVQEQINKILENENTT